MLLAGKSVAADKGAAANATIRRPPLPEPDTLGGDVGLGIKLTSINGRGFPAMRSGRPGVALSAAATYLEGASGGRVRLSERGTNTDRTHGSKKKAQRPTRWCSRPLLPTRRSFGDRRMSAEKPGSEASGSIYREKSAATDYRDQPSATSRPMRRSSTDRWASDKA